MENLTSHLALVLALSSTLCLLAYKLPKFFSKIQNILHFLIPVPMVILFAYNAGVSAFFRLTIETVRLTPEQISLLTKGTESPIMTVIIYTVFFQLLIAVLPSLISQIQQTENPLSPTDN